MKTALLQVSQGESASRPLLTLQDMKNEGSAQVLCVKVKGYLESAHHGHSQPQAENLENVHQQTVLHRKLSLNPRARVRVSHPDRTHAYHYHHHAQPGPKPGSDPIPEPENPRCSQTSSLEYLTSSL